ncbi:DUF2155 domain-containing protein [Acetobacteraceae bacterium KSS8]|uniref:DUF2155 domain-containing protein n=1 Tax=Endosaccharibacter trunci TaxID=2812733 RepID=A0ABT1W9G6_9PROT|nr:DUF2155 domain-containing protein [Acetobacteraceae bacterium KSS8]
MKRAFLAALLVSPASALAADYVPPPIMPLPNAWQGRSTGVVRILDKLDARVEVLTLAPGQTGHYKSLSVTLRACMDRPDGIPHDSAAFLDVQDGHGNGQPFTGWTFANEPSIGVFESPIYGVQLVNCQGDKVAPLAPPLPAPVPAPPGLLNNVPQAPAPSTGGPDAGDTGSDLTAPDAVDQGQPDIQPPPPGPPSNTPASHPPSPPPGTLSAPAADSPAPSDGAPDAVYPSGAPPKRR